MSRITLTEARAQLGWSQSRLARESGENVSAIFDIEAERSKHPSFVRVVRIYKALRCGGLNQRIHIEDIFPVPDPPACRAPKKRAPFAVEKRSQPDRRSILPRRSAGPQGKVAA